MKERVYMCPRCGDTYGSPTRNLRCYCNQRDASRASLSLKVKGVRIDGKLVATDATMQIIPAGVQCIELGEIEYIGNGAVIRLRPLERWQVELLVVMGLHAGAGEPADATPEQLARNFRSKMAGRSRIEADSRMAQLLARAGIGMQKMQDKIAHKKAEQ